MAFTKDEMLSFCGFILIMNFLYNNGILPQPRFTMMTTQKLEDDDIADYNCIDEVD